MPRLVYPQDVPGQSNLVQITWTIIGGVDQNANCPNVRVRIDIKSTQNHITLQEVVGSSTKSLEPIRIAAISTADPMLVIAFSNNVRHANRFGK
jgi:hypothetical protein